MDVYLLPSHPSLISIDPLGLCDEENPTVWSVISTAIHSFRAASKVQDLPDLIEDLTYSIHMDGKINTQYLSYFLGSKFYDFGSSAILNNILDDALLLLTMFPTHTIHYLNTKNPILHLSMQQIRSLLAHQILNTLNPPQGNTWGCTFVCWYSDPQAYEKAVSGYLGALFHYFNLPIDSSANMTFHFYRSTSTDTGDDLTAWVNTASGSVCDHIELEPTSTETIEFPHKTIPCTLVASNKSPGFGTSCTQEELVTGACPPLLLLGALFISPPVPPDATLLAYGHSIITHWRGQGREAHSLGTFSSCSHTFLLLDASELDMVPALSTEIGDLHPLYLMRDLNKAYTGFLALRHLQITEISSPLWGAGAFSGDPIVKALILAIAGARAGVTVHLSVDKKRHYTLHNDKIPVEPFSTVLTALERFKQHPLTIREILEKLTSNEAAHFRNGLDVVSSLLAISDSRDSP